MIRKVVLTSLAAATLAQGQTSSGNICSNDVSISAQADIDALASCTRLTKDVTINADASLTNVQLSNIQSIGGDLNINGANIISVNLPLVNAIGGTWTMNNLTSVNTISVPSLTRVGNIDWEVLGPLLRSVAFGSGLTTAGDVNITNTQLQTLDGITLQTVNHLVIANNRYLKTLNMQIHNATSGIIVNANGQDQLDVSFPNLQWAAGASFRNCANVSLPVVQRINGSLEINENTLQTFEAPKLTRIDQALAFVMNSQLTNFSFPVLTDVHGGLLVAANPDLDDLNGLPKLQTVVGSVNCTGNFTDASFPSLEDVEGTFNFQSSSTFDCTTIQGYNNKQVKGTVTCSGNNPNPETSTNNQDGSGSGSSSNGGKKNAAGMVSVNTFGMLAVAAIIGALAL